MFRATQVILVLNGIYVFTGGTSFALYESHK
jgi:hypothetical protein